METLVKAALGTAGILIAIVVIAKIAADKVMESSAPRPTPIIKEDPRPPQPPKPLALAVSHSRVECKDRWDTTYFKLQ